MTLESRIARLERDHEAEGQWPCPQCGRTGPVVVFRAEKGEDGVVRQFDRDTGAELPEEPCSGRPCHRRLIMMPDNGRGPNRLE
jgi:hypothetical protein